MSIKKAYQEIVTHLEENAHASVADVLPKVIEMASAKVGRSSAGNAFIKDVNDVVVAIRCYYFKRWMPVTGDEAVEFGKKASTSTGFNTMCKEGLSAWTKRERVAKQAEASILDDVTSGTLAPEGIADARAKIAQERTKIEDTELGFETREEVETFLTDNGVTLTQ